MDNVEGENVAVMEQEVSPARPEKRKRDELTCSSFVVNQDQWNILDDPKDKIKEKTLKIMNEAWKQFKSRFLDQKCRETASKGKVNLCALLDPGRINGMMLEWYEDDCVDYLRKAMHHARGDQKKFLLLPYNQSSHWCLLVIVPLENTIYVMDSSRPDKSITTQQSKRVMPVIIKAFWQYLKEGGVQSTGKSRNKMNGLWKECPQQIGGWECGYYTMIFMFHFVESIQFKWPEYPYSSKSKSYSKEQLDHFRCMWADFFIKQFCKP
ncbi:uncharacterized protein LOC144547936 [Carex rostrata]